MRSRNGLRLFDGRGRADGEARLAACRANPEGLGDIVVRLHVNGDRAGDVCKSRKELIWLVDHQVNVQRKLRVREAASTTSGPKEMLSTKCPSITSQWIQSAPPSVTRTISCRAGRNPLQESRERRWFYAIPYGIHSGS